MISKEYIQYNENEDPIIASTLDKTIWHND